MVELCTCQRKKYLLSIDFLQLILRRVSMNVRAYLPSVSVTLMLISAGIIIFQPISRATASQQSQFVKSCKAEARSLNKTTWHVVSRDVPLSEDSYGYYVLESSDGRKVSSRMYGMFPSNQEIRSKKDPNFHPREKVKIFLEGVSYNECVWGIKRIPR